MRLRTMSERDVPAGLRLNNLAGWNQTAADWHRFLRASPDGCFVAEIDTRVCGTATTICYQDRFAWIGMVLVDPEYRKRGIGTQLLKRTIEYLDHRRIPTMKLDATPQGQPLYEKLGFVTEYEIQRWILKRPADTAGRNAKSSPFPLNEAQLVSILGADQIVFGADRGFLLRSLHDEFPEFAMGAWDNGTPQGYAFGRRGNFADHLGPWMARNWAAAEELLNEFLKRSARATLVVDCLTANPLAIKLLLACGFVHSRALMRMHRGPNAHPGKSDSLCAIAGPEFG
ncbi:MAG: GNAT family N-acetyltransferase [Candidatus Acidiferrum sp.]